MVCASCAARGGHVKAAATVPQEGHAAVTDEKKKTNRGGGQGT